MYACIMRKQIPGQSAFLADPNMSKSFQDSKSYTLREILRHTDDQVKLSFNTLALRIGTWFPSASLLMKVSQGNEF